MLLVLAIGLAQCCFGIPIPNRYRYRLFFGYRDTDIFFNADTDIFFNTDTDISAKYRLIPIPTFFFNIGIGIYIYFLDSKNDKNVELLANFTSFSVKFFNICVILLEKLSIITYFTLLFSPINF